MPAKSELTDLIRFLQPTFTPYVFGQFSLRRVRQIFVDSTTKRKHYLIPMVKLHCIVELQTRTTIRSNHIEIVCFQHAALELLWISLRCLNSVNDNNSSPTSMTLRGWGVGHGLRTSNSLRPQTTVPMGRYGCCCSTTTTTAARRR